MEMYGIFCCSYNIENFLFYLFILTVEMPQINVFSKADLIEKNGRLHFNLDYYTEVQDLTRLRDYLSVCITILIFSFVHLI